MLYLENALPEAVLQTHQYLCPKDLFGHTVILPHSHADGHNRNVPHSHADGLFKRFVPVSPTPILPISVTPMICPISPTLVLPTLEFSQVPFCLLIRINKEQGMLFFLKH